MNELGDFSGLGKGDGAESGLQTLNKEPSGRKVRTGIRIQEQDMLAGTGRTAGVDHRDPIIDELLCECPGIVDGGGQEYKPRRGAVMAA